MTTKTWRCLSTLLSLLLTGCGRDAAPKMYSTVWYPMGTFAEVKIYTEDSGLPEVALQAAQGVMQEIETLMSLYRPESELSRLNAAAGTAVAVSELTADMLRLSKRFAELTDGCFDVTVAPLVRFWGFSGGTPPAQLPTQEQIADLLALAGYERLQVSNVHGSVWLATLPDKGMSVDLGGIAKGYAVDLCGTELLAMGISNSLVNLGGNIRAFGEPEPGRPWTIGIRDPFDTATTLGVVTLRDGQAVATSGNYERFSKIEGKRFAHIMDPRTGYPVEGMAGVSVIANSATEADVLSTALFVAGVEQGLRILERFAGSEAIFVLDDVSRRIIVTPGFRAALTPRSDIADSLSAAP